MKNQEAYLKAKKRVEARMGFFIHLTVYLLVNTFLTILNLVFSSDYFWAIWPMLGWSSGLIIHGVRTFVFTAESSLKERLIEKEMRERRYQ
jgi:hypothetical protein